MEETPDIRFENPPAKRYHNVERMAVKYTTRYWLHLAAAGRAATDLDAAEQRAIASDNDRAFKIMRNRLLGAGYTPDHVNVLAALGKLIATDRLNSGKED